jgi:hypothetical protein
MAYKDEYPEYGEYGELEEFEDVFEKQARKRKLLITAINSTILYLLAYLINYMFYYIVTINRAADFGIKATLYYWKIGWLAGPDSPLWFQYSIKYIFSVGPFSSFGLALLFVGIYAVRRTTKGLLPLFCIWMALHGLNMFLGSISVGLLTTINAPYTSQILKTISDFIFFTKDASYSSQGFGYVADWLYFTSTTKIALFILAFVISILLGFFSAPLFLRSSQSAQLIRSKQSRHALIIFQTIIPWLLGSLFLLIIRFPHDTRYEIYFFLTMLIMVSPSLLNVLRDPASFREILIMKQPKQLEISKPFLFTMLGAYALFRFIFSYGIFVNLKPY